MATQVSLDVEALRHEVKVKYAAVAQDPGSRFHFHTGRPLAELLGYPSEFLEAVPEACVESFAGVGNPFSMGEIGPGETVVDVGSGAGFDSLVAAQMVGEHGRVIGIDMTPEMLRKARRNAQRMRAANVKFRKGLAEALPLPDGVADVVISNGIFNLVPDMQAALRETFRVLKPSGRLYLSDIVANKRVPDSAKEEVDLWTD